MIGYEIGYSYVCPACFTSVVFSEKNPEKIGCCPNCWIKERIKEKMFYKERLFIKEVKS